MTLAGNQADADHIQERLDKFLASQNWIGNFQNYYNNHLLRYASDHTPILLEFWSNNECRMPKKHNTLPKFEQLWLENEDSNHIVRTTWNYSTGNLEEKLKDTLHHLHSWGKEQFGDIPRTIQKLQKELQNIKESYPDINSLSKIKEHEGMLDNAIKREELWWAQRTKVNWLQASDKNSKFFHIKASQRKRKNIIKSIQHNDGRRWTDACK